MQLASPLLELASRPAARDLAITFSSRSAQMLLALAGNVISARALGPDQFGRFGLVMAVVMVCGTLADAGLTYTAVKYIAQYEVAGDPGSSAVAHTYLTLKLATGLFFATVSILSAGLITTYLFADPALTPYLQLGFATLLSLAVSSYPGTVLVGLSKFGRLGVAAVLNASITLAGIVALLLSGRLDLGSLIAWNVILPVVSTIPAWFLLPTEWLPWRLRKRNASDSRGVNSEMIGFSKWMAVSNLGSILTAHADILLLGRLAGPATVGVYSVALTLASRLDTLNQSLLTIMLPRASRLQGHRDIASYTRRVLRGSAGLAVGLAVVALAAQPLIVLLYGERYTASAPLFLALIGVVLFDLITSSLFLVAFPLNRPRVLAFSDWLRVGVLGAAGWLLIPAFGGFGAVAARFLSRLVGAVYTLVALRRAPASGEGERKPEAAAASSWPS